MPSITNGISNLIGSILDIFRSIINTIFSAIQSVFAIGGTLVQDVLNLMRGLFEFLLGNFLIIGVLIAAFVGWSAYQQRQQRGTVTSGKKRA